MVQMANPLFVLVRFLEVFRRQLLIILEEVMDPNKTKQTAAQEAVLVQTSGTE